MRRKHDSILKAKATSVSNLSDTAEDLIDDGDMNDVNLSDSGELSPRDRSKSLPVDDSADQNSGTTNDESTNRGVNERSNSIES